MRTPPLLAAALLLLGACASKPPPPEWKANAASALHAFSNAQLSGNTRLADFEFKQAQSEISRTGRLDLMARAELTRCAVQVASLDWSTCTAYEALAPKPRQKTKRMLAFWQVNGRDLTRRCCPRTTAA